MLAAVNEETAAVNCKLGPEYAIPVFLTYPRRRQAKPLPWKRFRHMGKLHTGTSSLGAA